VCTHPERYDESAPDCVNPLLYVKEIVVPVYSDLCHEIAGISQSCDITAVLALSYVIGYPIHTFWPPLNGSLYQQPLTQQLVGRGVSKSEQPVNLMWSTSQHVPLSRAVVMDHFVPLFEKCDVDDVLNARSSGSRKRKPLCSDNGAAECDVVVLDSSSSIDRYDDDDVLHPTSSVCRKRKKVSIHTAGRMHSVGESMHTAELV